MKKTNAMRILDNAKIPYAYKEYAYDENDLTGVHAAAVLKFDPAMVYKTLVAQGDKTGPCVFCVPVAAEVDLKKAARASDNKRVELIHVKELPALTGYIRGGCSPIGMKKKFPTFFDEAVLAQEKISVSAGQRGCQVVVARDALLQVVQAKTADITVHDEHHS